MLRKIITIDEDKCNGCGLCVTACHENAIVMQDGKARLLADNYCDGLGDCLPACPTDAISFELREALPYDEEAVTLRMQQLNAGATQDGCPASRPRQLEELGSPLPRVCPGSMAKAISQTHSPSLPANTAVEKPASQLAQWPVQLKLVPVNAPYFNDAKLLVAADCAAYAHANFHAEFMRNTITLIGCPKLDEGDYSQKLTAILQGNSIKSLTLVRMEVPCCGGLENAAQKALRQCGKLIPWRVVTLGTNGTILDDSQ